MSLAYRTGTVGIANGATTVTGTLTAWINNVKAGDFVRLMDGAFYEVASDPVSNTSITIVEPYGGATVASGGAYTIFRFSPGWRPTAEISQRLGPLLDRFSSATGVFLHGTGVPSDALGVDGDLYIRTDVPTLYDKASATWGAGVPLTGPAGPGGPAPTATSATSLSVGSGTKTLTTQAGRGFVVGSRIRAASAATPSKYMEGVVTTYTSTTMIFTADRFGGSGSAADWNISIAGDVGSTGPQGAGYSATSTASLLIGSGSKAFTGVGTTLGYTNGQRIRASSAADSANYMEGRVASYAGGTLTVLVDITGGSGAFADWTINIAGERGVQGIQGTQGDTGLTGAEGPGYAATSASSLAIGTGSKSLTTQTGLAYASGTRVRVAVATSTGNFFEGICVYTPSTGAMTIEVDYAAGSGTFADWTISVAGERGAAGISLTHQGDYNSGTTYSLGHTVLDQNSSWTYINATPSAGNAPPTLPTTSSSHWQLAARAGVDGTGSGTVTSVNGQSPVSGGAVTVKADAIEINTLTPTGYTPSGATVEQHLAGISSALQSAGVNPNLLINGDGMVFQRSGAITTSADDTYHVDRWYALTQSGTCTATQRLDAANGVPFLIRTTQSSASSQRVGAAQILEAVDSKVLRGETVTLSGKAALSVNGTVRFAILEWTGTADSVTSDVVSNWASATFTAGNFFLGSNLTVAAVGSQAVTANTLTDYSLSATLSGSCNNLIVLVWSDTVLTQTSTFDFRAKLERASSATAWVKECYADIINRCYRYYYRLFSSVLTNAAGSFRQATNSVSIMHYSPVPFRVAPTFSHSSPTWATAAPSGNQIANFNYVANGYTTITGALSLIYTGGPGTMNRFYAQAATSFSGTAGDISLFQIGTSAWFAFDAEL